MEKNKTKKILIVIMLCFCLCGCTKTLKDKDGNIVRNEKTGQNMTENIICQPTKDVKLYEENGVNVKKLPKCSDMKLTGQYEGLWNTFFVRPLAYAIIQVGKIVNSTCLSIIIITLVLRLILFPLTKKTAMQSENIKDAQPELNRLEKKYEGKTDNESMARKGQEMMLIYKKYNISPLSGCLFAFLQLPILFAFLEAINRVPAIFEETKFGFQMGTTPLMAIKSGNWYYIILTILILITTFFSFKMNQSVAAPELQQQNRTMMWFMVIFIGFMSFQLTTAIAVYWVVSSLFTIIQNIFTDVLKKNKKGAKVKVKLKG